MTSGYVQGSKTAKLVGLADDAVQSLSGSLDEAGSIRAVVTDTAGALPGGLIIVSYRRVAVLGGTYAVRSYGTLGMELAAYDTALTGTTGDDNTITFSIRGDGSLEIENRSGGIVDISVIFETRSVP